MPTGICCPSNSAGLAMCDLIHQTALEDRQPVAEANDDVAPEVFLCLEEQTMRVLGRVFRREGFELAVDLLNALRRDHAVRATTM